MPENETVIVSDINNHVKAGYGRKVYIGKVFEIDDSHSKILFFWIYWDFINRFIFLQAQKEGWNLSLLRKHPVRRSSSSWNQAKKVIWKV